MELLHDSLGKLTPASEKILETASKLFYSDGIHAVGVDRIAEESGVTKKTLYERFGSKEGLTLAYLRRREDQWRTALDRLLALRPDPGTERILAVFDAADLWYTGVSTKGCSAVNARAESGPELTSIPVEVAEQKTWMLDRFRELCVEAGFQEADQISRSLLLLLEGALVTLGTRSFKAPMQQARRAAEALLTAHSPSSPARKEP